MNPGRVALKQKAMDGVGRIGRFPAGATVPDLEPVQIQMREDLDHKIHQIVLRKPVLNRRRKKIDRAPVGFLEWIRL